MTRSAHRVVSRAALDARVGELGTAIARAHDADAEPPVLVAVLKGSTMFLSDLVRKARLDLIIDFMAISSYAEPETRSGVVRIVKDLDTDIGGRDVIIVEDIVDTGLTLTYLRRALLQRGCRRLETVALLDKRARRIVPVPVEHVGFEIPDVFVVGYGLDYQGLYRNLRDIYAVPDIVALKQDPLAPARDLFVDEPPTASPDASLSA